MSVKDFLPQLYPLLSAVPLSALSLFEGSDGYSQNLNPTSSRLHNARTQLGISQGFDQEVSLLAIRTHPWNLANLFRHSRLQLSPRSTCAKRPTSDQKLSTPEHRTVRRGESKNPGLG